MTQPRDTVRLLEERIEELESQLDLARSASRSNWHRFVKAQGVIYKCFRWMDVSLDLETMQTLSLHYDWYKEGCNIIGWDVDWDAVSQMYKNL